MSEDDNYNLIRKRILNWFSDNKQDYPWRKSKNLYQILITEILLQKTIASNVANIYNNFFEKYKTFVDIYKTDIRKVQSDIKSLGLSNKRAKILKDLSEMVLIKYDGRIPEDTE